MSRSILPKSIFGMAVLAFLLSVVFSPAVQRLDDDSIAKVDAATKLKLTNIGSKKTIYQYLTLTIKTNVKVSKCKFVSSKKSVATVSKKGIITAKKKGTATITVKYGKQAKKIKLTVKAASKKYSPSRVAQIANQRLKTIKNKNGKKMVFIPEDMKKLYQAGKMTKKEYKKYYPDGGTGYLICYYELNLNETRSLGGNRLKTESDIANDIIGYYKVSNSEYFYVKYAGKKIRSGMTYYVFHLHKG